MQLLYTLSCICQASLDASFNGVASYLNLARSAIIDSRVDEVPRGLYLPTSHSLIVCWRVPNCSASSRWVSPKCCLRAWMRWLSHCGRFTLRWLLIARIYTIQGKLSSLIRSRLRDRRMKDCWEIEHFIENEGTEQAINAC